MKSFLTHDQQVVHLNKVKKIKTLKVDKEVLAKKGYYNVVSSYMHPFIQSIDSIDKKYTFIGGTTLQHIFYVKEFDDTLRKILFECICEFEEEIRANIGYQFDKYNDSGNIHWNERKAYYSKTPENKLNIFINVCFETIQQTNNADVSYHLAHNQYIPVWILTKILSFKDVITFLNLSKINVKDAICNIYGIKNDRGYPDRKLLFNMLNWIRKVRNVCAHNERLFDLSTHNLRIVQPFREVNFPESYINSRNNSFNLSIIDVLVYLYYFIPTDKYHIIIKKILELLTALSENLNNSAFRYIKSSMGIKDIDNLNILIDTKHKSINYLYNKV